MNAGRLGPDRSMWLILAAGVLVGLAAGLVVFFGLPLPSIEEAVRPNPAAAGNGPAPAPVVGAPAPDFTLDVYDGGSVTLSDLKGKVVLVNFWATWCGPCRIEMPAFEARYRALKDAGLVVLAVNLDEPASDVAAYVESLDLTFPVLLDPRAKVNDLYRVRGYPSTFIVNPEGIIARSHIGLLTEGQLDSFLGELGLGGS